MYKNIDWNIGSLFVRDNEMLHIIDNYNKNCINHNIKYTFGSIPCIMQGGRVSFIPWDLQDAFNIIDKYNDRGIGCRFTFSNNLLTEDDLNDYTSNKLLDYINSKSGNGVIVSSDLLAEYVKREYPDVQIISSQVKPSVEVGLGESKDTVDYYNNLFDLYDIVVINPAKVHDNKFLESIKYKDRVEFIVNHRCQPNCPKAKQHYEYQIHLMKEKYCGKNNSVYAEKLNTLSINCESIMNPLYKGVIYSKSDIEKLIDFGFTHFKIEGRHLSDERFFQDIHNYVLY